MDGPYQSRTKWFYEKFAKSFDNLQPKKSFWEQMTPGKSTKKTFEFSLHFSFKYLILIELYVLL